MAAWAVAAAAAGVPALAAVAVRHLAVSARRDSSRQLSLSQTAQPLAATLAAMGPPAAVQCGAGATKDTPVASRV